jgi:hypothetical protein
MAYLGNNITWPVTHGIACLCPSCQALYHQLPYTTLSTTPQFTQETFTWSPQEEKEEEPVSDTNRIKDIPFDELIDSLESARASRDAAVRLAQMENDLASLHEVEAVRHRSLADLIEREVNELAVTVNDPK